MDRRELLRLVGLSLASIGTGAAVLGVRRSRAKPIKPAPHKLAEAPWEFVAPLTQGSTVGGMTLAAMATSDGVVNVDFEKPDGKRFRVRVCKRDGSDGAPKPVAHSRHLDFFLANNGKGLKPTDEREGVTVMVLASIARRNEGSTPRLAVGTIRQRWQRLAIAQG